MLKTDSKTFFDYLFKNKVPFSAEKFEYLRNESKEFLHTPLKIMALLIAVSGLLAMIFEIRYFTKYSYNVYFTRLSATLIAFGILTLMYKNIGRKHPVLMVHILLLTIIASSGYMIYLMPTTLVVNAQIVGLMIFISAMFLSWEVKNQIIVAIYYNLTFATAILLNDKSVYFLPNMYESVIFILFLSSISIIASAINFRLRLDIAEKTFNVEQSEKKYKAIFNNSAEGIFQSTKEGKFIICNSSLVKILGYESKDELMKVNIRESIFKNPGERDKLLKEIEEKNSIQNYVISLKKKDGNDVIVRLNDSIFYDDETEEYYYEGNMQDITEQVHADLKRRKIEEELKEEKLKSDALAREALESNTFKSKFLASMSHEVRTPLNGVLGYLTLLEGEAYKNYEEMKMFINSSKKSAELLLDIVNDILDLSRIESGKMELDEINFNLKDVIDESFNVVLSKAKEKNLYLLKDVNPNIPINLVGDPVRVRQILVNLLSNAIKFTEQGKVELKINFDKLPDDKINIKASISDTGIGIPKEKIDTLFKPFSRIHESYTRNIAGTGLGLVICKEFISLMNGEINVESESRNGSVFYFNIKLEEQKTDATVLYGEEIAKNNNIVTSRKESKMSELSVQTLNKSDIKQKRGEINILLAEDNMINQKVILRIINDAGFKTESVANGLLALEAVKKNNYSLVLMDIQMPEMDGLTATKNIRELENGKKNIPIIAITAHAMKGDREKCLDAGMDDYATKPIIAEELIKIIDKWAFRNGTVNSIIEKSEEVVEQQEVEMSDGFDFEHLNKMSLGSIDFQKELLITYIEDVVVRMEKLGNFIESNNIEKVNHESHTIKGASLSVGALKMGETALAIELSAKNNDISNSKKNFEKLKLVLVDTEKIIKNFLEKELS